jgi:hypothetical protein
MIFSKPAASLFTVLNNCNSRLHMTLACQLPCTQLSAAMTSDEDGHCKQGSMQYARHDKYNDTGMWVNLHKIIHLQEPQA